MKFQVGREWVGGSAVLCEAAAPKEGVVCWCRRRAGAANRQASKQRGGGVGAAGADGLLFGKDCVESRKEGTGEVF